jgi:hypothetical protein
MKIVKPRSSTTCSKYNYLKKENENKLIVQCNKCKDKDKCVYAD